MAASHPRRKMRWGGLEGCRCRALYREIKLLKDKIYKNLKVEKLHCPLHSQSGDACRHERWKGFPNELGTEQGADELGRMVHSVSCVHALLCAAVMVLGENHCSSERGRACTSLGTGENEECSWGGTAGSVPGGCGAVVPQGNTGMW